ncbi:hypothetical protein DPMN_190372 [Dreissena polymorpha]|uniref:C1q domain-containing protein n=1 Tax=Dreissena polymorpha TaxID=45954 RepID=A0A9D4DX53_DREPO|nr:hypothetical protein DPMN_190372 [Dreissena polymorpha]
MTSGNYVIFASVYVNEGLGYNRSNGRFTVSVTGLYVFTVQHCIQDTINVMTKFHDDSAKNVTSRVFTRKTAPTPPTAMFLGKCALTPGSHKTNVLTKFRENWAINVTSSVFTCFHYLHIEKTAPSTGGNVFSPIWTIFELFYDDWEKIVTSRVFTRCLYSQVWKTAPPTGSNVFQRTGTTFELNQHII